MSPSLKASSWRLENTLAEHAVAMLMRVLTIFQMPLLNDPKFTKDREDYSGRSWSKEKIAANRPEALAFIRNAFNVLETTLLSDGREWLLKTDQPKLADIEGKQEVHCVSLRID